ncbi:superoxide dismutase family protein [Sphingomonas sp. BN140010]|uniref:Superoxide dismutase [Cu-Zn] n=1 Tax=Sphingomonas arvum TaxID=2992113 RepID=A0ABT3JCY1_9SPHN|nr:superoxide dismutase family protein [Sphingomonas sp. BN140010]MCW3796923.1 superoxide dismutase family protein [Sphingomonas sp. BN140010]
MRSITITALLGGAAMLGACQGQNRSDAQDVLNMQNDAQAVPNDGGLNAVGTSTTGAGAVLDSTLRTADGKDVGVVAVREEDGGVVLQVSARNMPPGTYGMHIHSVGKCEGPKFESAGAHWNPDNKQHGTKNPKGPHAGDLPNLQIGPGGNGGANFTLQAALRTGLAPMLDTDGAALMIHAKADDMKTDPSGNSGDRIACAVIGGGS